MLAWLIAYLLTCAVEVPIVVAMVIAVGWRPRRGVGEVVALAWALQLTHPLLWLIRPPFPSALLVAEAAIVVIEGAALFAWAVARGGAPRTVRTFSLALLTALVANAASLALGLLLSAV